MGLLESHLPRRPLAKRSSKLNFAEITVKRIGMAFLSSQLTMADHNHWHMKWASNVLETMRNINFLSDAVERMTCAPSKSRSSARLSASSTPGHTRPSTAPATSPSGLAFKWTEARTASSSESSTSTNWGLRASPSRFESIILDYKKCTWLEINWKCFCGNFTPAVRSGIIIIWTIQEHIELSFLRLIIQWFPQMTSGYKGTIHLSYPSKPFQF